MTPRIKNLVLLLTSATALAISGCAAYQEQETNPSQIKTQWVSPHATTEHRTVNSMIVVCIGGELTNQKVCEDSVANMFTYRGVNSFPSYLYEQDSSKLLDKNNVLSTKKLISMAKKGKVTDILVIADQGDKTHQEIEPGMVMDFGPVLMRGGGGGGPGGGGPGGGGFGGGGPGGGHGGPGGPGGFGGPGGPGGPGPGGPGPGHGPGPGPGPGPFGPPPPGPGGFFYFGSDVYTIPPTVTEITIKNTSTQLLHGSTGNVLWSASAGTILGQYPMERTWQLYAEMVYDQLVKDGFMFPLSGIVVAPNMQPVSGTTADGIPIVTPGIRPANEPVK